MNGYELADRLEDSTENFTCIYNISAATKLRQLQSENEALKRPNNVVGVPQDKLVDMQVTMHQLQQERDLLFSAHSHEMVRADKLAIELERALVVINSVANGYIEESYDKVFIQNREQIKWCKDFLESVASEQQSAK
jgi:hypothetical protein